MKYLFLFLTSTLIFLGCASSINTSSFSPSQRLNYAMRLYNDKDYENSVKEFQAIILQYPGNDVVDTAQYYLGESRFQRSEYIMAAYEFSRLIKNMPASKLVPAAQYMLAQSYYELSPYYALDQKYTKKAIEEFQAFIDFFPTDPKVPDAEKKISELNDKLAEKEYKEAYIYEKLEDYKAAIIYYDLVLDNYHDTQYAPLAMYSKIKLLVYRKQNDEALAAISKFIEKYPNDSHVKEIEKIKTSLEGKLSASK